MFLPFHTFASVFGRLADIRKSKNTSLSVKVKSLVISTLLYGAETMATACHTDEEIGSCSSQVPTKTVDDHMEGQSQE